MNKNTNFPLFPLLSYRTLSTQECEDFEYFVKYISIPNLRKNLCSKMTLMQEVQINNKKIGFLHNYLCVPDSPVACVTSIKNSWSLHMDPNNQSSRNLQNF